MTSPAVLAAVGGFLTALVTVGIPTAKVLLDTRRDARRAVRLLTGDDAQEGDGVLPRLRDVERRSVEHRLALDAEPDITVPDLEDEGREGVA